MPEPSTTGKPWDGMDPLGEFSTDFRLSLSDAEADEFAEWRSWHEEARRRAEDEQFEREQLERDEKLQDEIRHEQETGEIDAYRLAHGASTPESTTVGIVDDQGMPLDAIVKDQPVRLQVTVPRRPGEVTPETVEVTVTGTRLTFIGREYQATDRVTLKWTGNLDGPAVYRTERLTVEKGGDGVESLGVPGFEFNVGGMDGFSVDDGDYITIQTQGATSGVQVFQSTARLELALTLEAIGSANQMYTNILINIANAEKQLPDLEEGPQKTELVSRINEMKGQAQQAVRLANNAIRYVNTTDTFDHQKLAVARLYATWLGLFREPVQNADGTTTAVPFGPMHVPDPRDENDSVLDTSRAAKEEVRRIMWSGLAQATIGGYRLLAQATLAAQIMTIAGMNEMGQRATSMERWMAFFDILSQGASMGAMVKWNLGTMLPRNATMGVPRTTARIPRTERITDPTAAAAAPSGTPVAPEAAGMLRHAARDGQLVARKYDRAIQVRFTSPDAMVPRATGAAPKSALVKSKTIKDIDRLIGAPENSQNGVAGFFEPKLPERGSMSDAQWAKVQERFELRQAEFEGPIGQYQRKLAEKGEIQFRDGMVCDKDGRPFAGDYDLFEISNRDGTPVPQSEYDAIVADLMAAPGFEAAHGAHMRWNPSPLDDAYHLDISGDLQTALDAIGKWRADRAIFREIVGRHQAGGEGLLTFAPNQPPVITYAGEAVGPKFADIGVTPIAPTTTSAGGLFVRPTLFVATTDQLLAGRYPEGPGWEWTQQYDWQAEVADWTIQSESLGAIPIARPSPTPSPAPSPAITAQPGNWRPYLLGGGLVVILLIGIATGFVLFSNQNAVVPPVALISPSPTAALPSAQPTQGGVAPPATQPAPDRTQPAQTTTPIPTQTVAPTIVPTVEPQQPNALLADALALFERTTDGLVAAPPTWDEGTNFIGDSAGDLYLPNDGSAATAIQPWVDLIGAFGVAGSISDGQAVGLSSHLCGSSFESRDGFELNMSCNQTGPMPSGDYLVISTAWDQQIPDPFPETAQCVFSVQSDVDNDRTTGFQSPLGYNYLIGADVYYEHLMFWDQAGEFRNYVLATDHSLPPRADTGEIHGNLPTVGRVIWGNELGSSVAGNTQTFVLPLDELGDNATVGGFCATDRAAMGPDTLAVDSVGPPVDEDVPLQVLALVDLLFPPRD